MKLSPEVQKEIKRIIIASVICCIVVLAICAVLDALVPNYDFFNYRTVLSLIVGTVVAVGNFILLAVTVRDASKIYDKEEEGRAKALLQTSFKRRSLLMLVWGVITLAVPCFNAAGLIPLLFPSTIIKILAISQAITDRKG